MNWCCDYEGYGVSCAYRDTELVEGEELSLEKEVVLYKKGSEDDETHDKIYYGWGSKLAHVCHCKDESKCPVRQMFANAKKWAEENYSTDLLEWAEEISKGKFYRRQEKLQIPDFGIAVEDVANIIQRIASEKAIISQYGSLERYNTVRAIADVLAPVGEQYKALQFETVEQAKQHADKIFHEQVVEAMKTEKYFNEDWNEEAKKVWRELHNASES